ncbi:MAG: DUF4124 domain-containing protein [Pseudomonadota bacterium]
MTTVDTAWACAMLMAAALAAPARAQTVYKCSVNGVTSYGDTPCASGASVAMPAPPPPQWSAADQARLERDRQRAAAFDAARAKEQAEQDRRGRQAARANAARDRKCATLRLAQRWAREDAAGLQGRAADKAARKARRAADSLALACPA